MAVGVLLKTIAAEVSTPPSGQTLAGRVDAAVAIARQYAGAVDADARFPYETFAALRAGGLLGLMLPAEAGGEGTSVSDVASICYSLGRVCSSSAMVYAMHQANIACIVQNQNDTPQYAGYLRRIGERQLLIASSTTEGQGGANIRSSVSAIVNDGTRISLSRDASVVSYGDAADVILSTARRSEESIATDQVLVLLFKDDYTLVRSVKWDVLGMRGTCSEGFKLEARGDIAQVLSTPYERIHRHSMLPVTHLMWAACWAGIAAGAVERAQGFVRKVSRTTKGVLPPGAPSATDASLSLMTLTNMVSGSLADYERRATNRDALEEMPFQTSLNMLKVSASELAIRTVMHALNAAGIAGYRNDSEFSIGRSLRDILSSSVMINNNRIMSNVATASLLAGVPERL